MVNASVNRYATSSIVTGATYSTLTIAFGSTATRPIPDRSGTFAVFCCRDRQAKLPRPLINRDRLFLPDDIGGLNGHYPAVRYYAIL